MFPGARVSLILRPVKADEQRSADNVRRIFHLIGEAYVHGIMHGEASPYVNDPKAAFEDIDLL